MSKLSKTTIVSLTPEGRRLAQKISALSVFAPDEIEHLHRPDSFKASVVERFQRGHRLIFVCATGIVIRTLADHLVSKNDDPPVIALDEHGRFVIPLLSGHEGGANDLAVKLANALSAQAVLTTAHRYNNPIVVVGMGCEKSCPEAKVKDLFYRVTEQYDINLQHLVGIASIDLKQQEAALLALANDMSVPLICYSAQELNTMEDRLSIRSDIVFKAVGCYGVAEAAALLHAQKIGQYPARLIVTKHKNAHATIAVALSSSSNT